MGMCGFEPDETTWSAARWNVLAPELGQRHELSKEKIGRTSPSVHIKEFLRWERSWGAFEKLARTEPDQPAVPITPLPPQFRNTSESLSPVELLPPELLRMVFSGLEVSDKVALGLCSQTLWCNFIHELQSFYRANIAPWAGKLIICTGSWLTDVPPEVHALYPEIDENERARPMTRNNRRRGMAAARRWNWDAYYLFTDVGCGIESRCLEAFKAHTSSTSSSRMPEKLQEELCSKLKKGYLYPQRISLGSSWVLRNLNTREIVHFSLAKNDDGDHFRPVIGCSHPWLTLDFVLTMRICWLGHLRDRGIELEAKRRIRPLHYGPWAGHRFDLIEAEDLDQTEAWKDCTSDVASEAVILRDALMREAEIDI